jgi:glucan phosphoethanolaminetransferase (alkaline phosphatase superfamily)
MARDTLKSLILAGWLWLPSLAVLRSDQLQGPAEVIALLGLSLFILAGALVLVPRVRLYFLLWSPLALLVLPYSYLTLAYGSVPGDAMLASVLHTSPAMSLQVLLSFGWRVWLVPASWLLYLLLAWSLRRDWRLAPVPRQRLLAGLLMTAMVAMLSRVTLAQRVSLPPLFEQATANLAFPSGLAMSALRLARYEDQHAAFVSVHGRPAGGTPASAPSRTPPQPEPLLVVLVIGESLRSDHLGINGYARNTTPQLAALGSELLTFPDVASTANWTNRAMPAIVARPMAGGRASVVQTFAEAGFRTAWLSNQEPNPQSAPAEVVEHAVDTQDFHLRTDVNLLPMFTSFVRQAGQRQFVVLHMIGSHIAYEERYGKDSKLFQPTLSDIGVAEPLLADKAAAINSYDNTVVEADKFLARVIATLRREERPAVLLFTSDHGENLFDDQRHLFMHAQAGATRYDTHVPLLVWMNGAYRASHPAVAQALHANLGKKISHTGVFATLLEIGAVDWDGRDPRQSFASASYVEGRREVAIDLDTRGSYESLK